LLKPYNDTNCNLERIGIDTSEKDNDGGYLLCSNMFDNIEGIINLGINGKDGLGCNLTNMKPVPNYQFDCTNPIVPACDNNLG
jgi:hypothetical protein